MVKGRMDILGGGVLHGIEEKKEVCAELGSCFDGLCVHHQPSTTNTLSGHCPMEIDSPPILYSILRIKRKRTDFNLPLDALLIDSPEPTTKRRKSDRFTAPLPTAAPAGIFRFAETVPLDSFEDDRKTQSVKDRISAFLLQPQTPAVQSPPPLPASTSTSTRKLPSNVFKPTPIIPPSNPPLVPPPPPSIERYKLITSSATSNELPSTSHDEVEVKEDDITIYEAIQVGVGGASSSSKSRGVAKQEAVDDELMNNFTPMLQEYLTLQQREQPKDEFVYDVYYRDLRTVESSSGGGGGLDVGNLDGLSRIGQLAGPDDEDDLLITSELSSEEEEEDEVDQDSNEENDYRNDYPSSESGNDEDRFDDHDSD